RQIAGAALGFDWLLEDVEAGHDGFPFGGRHEAGQDPHRGGLAGAIGPEKAEDLAPFYPEADVVDRRHTAVLLGEVLNFNHRTRLLSPVACDQPKMVTEAPVKRLEE